MFVTVWLGILNIRTGELSFANGGHTSPRLLHRDGSGEWVKGKSGIMLGSVEDLCYKPRSLTLVPGDILYLYTDGVVESNNCAGEFYEGERLQNALSSGQARKLGPVEMCLMVKEDLDAFAGGVPQFDDITMLALEFKGLQEI